MPNEDLRCEVSDGIAQDQPCPAVVAMRTTSRQSDLSRHIPLRRWQSLPNLKRGCGKKTGGACNLQML